MTAVRSVWTTVPRSRLRRGRCDVDVFAEHHDGPTARRFVCVHGLGGSHVNWSLLAPLLRDAGEVWAPDLAGFGLTAPSGRSASVDDNLDLLAGFVETVGGDGQTVLIGNSLGGLLSLRLAARRPELVHAVIAIAPASPRPVAAPLDRQVVTNFALSALPFVGEQWLARRYRRTTPEQQVAQTMALCAADPAAIDAAQIARHVEIARRRRTLPYTRRAYLQASRSMLWSIGPGAPRLYAELARIMAPVLLLSGAHDRLVTTAAIDALAARHGNWTAARYADLGHLAMLEDPARVADDIMGWVSSHPASRCETGAGPYAPAR